MPNAKGIVNTVSEAAEQKTCDTISDRIYRLSNEVAALRESLSASYKERLGHEFSTVEDAQSSDKPSGIYNQVHEAIDYTNRSIAHINAMMHDLLKAI